MFESKLEEALGDPSALLRLAADTVAAERQAGCRKLVIAAAWAGCHGAPTELELADDAAIEAQSALVDRFVRIGPTGTPLVAECSPAELGKALQTGPAAAKNLMRVALIVRYRLPRLWERVKAGEVWLWKVRQIAERSAHLGALTSWCLDMQITRWVEQVAWARFLDIFDAALLRVDEDTYRRRAEEAAGQRDVRSFRGEQGLRTLVARMEAGDDAAFMALVNRVAQCLAEEGDEDPVGIRRSKAMGIIAHQAKLRDILARHAADPDDPRHPEERVAAHLDDPTDPWAEDDVPQAGWQTAGHGNYHQPGFDDLDDLEDCWNSQSEPASEEPASEGGATADGSESPVDEDDRAWLDEQRDTQPAAADGRSEEAVEAAGMDASPSPEAFGSAEPGSCATSRDERGACRACGSTYDLRPFTKAGLAACATKAVIHVHVTDQTLIDQHGVLRTADGPITLEQFRRWLTDADPTITIRPVLDPAAVAPVDSYEIPMAIREAVHTRHPGSVWPFSPVTEISTGGRLDLDHTRSYRKNGPPGQTSVDSLAPLARSEHRAKTVGGWQVRSPSLGTYVWRSPHGWISIVTNQGTLLLGDGPWTCQLWETVSSTGAGVDSTQANSAL